MNGPEAKLLLNSNVQPRFLRERQVSYKYREAAEELDRLVAEDIIEPVEWRISMPSLLAAKFSQNST